MQIGLALVLGFLSMEGVGRMAIKTSAQTILEFDGGDKATWRTIDDRVMGGVSHSRLLGAPSGIAIFEGHVSLENNGGFASVRAWLQRRDLSQFDGLALRVRGDGRSYRLRLRTNQGFDGIAYQARFETTGDGWEEILVPFTAFEPTFRGRTLSDVEPLNLASVYQLGFMIADGREGEFRLEIDWVRAYAAR